MSRENSSAPDGNDALWQYWFSLKTDARQRRWEILRQRLGSEDEYPLPAHPFVVEVFHAAANAGETDIIQTLFDRGFSLDSETISETLARLLIHHTGTSAGTIAYLLHREGADHEEALNVAAASGRIDVLEILSGAGVDMTAGNGSFFLALYKGHPAVMHYLYEKGAGLYHPAVIAAQYGRKRELPEEKADISIRVYRDLVEMDNEDAYVLHSSSEPVRSIAEMRERVTDAEGRIYTRLQLAVRAGKWDEIAAVARHDKTGHLLAEDILAADGKGKSAFCMLAAQGKIADIFSEDIWYRAPAQVAQLHAELEKFSAEKLVNLDKLTVRMEHRAMQEKASAVRSFRLQPRGRRP